jgi:hypothetical protein
MNKRIIIISFIIVCILVAGGFFASQYLKKGTLKLMVQTSGAVVTLDGRIIKDTSVQLDPNMYVVEVTKTGYISQKQTIAIETGKTTTLSFNLLKNGAANDTYSEVKNNVYGSLSEDELDRLNLRVSATKEFENGLWIVAKLESNTDPTKVLLKKDDSGHYAIVLGPGTSFDPEALATLPTDVQAAMKGTTSL